MAIRYKLYTCNLVPLALDELLKLHAKFYTYFSG